MHRRGRAVLRLMALPCAAGALALGLIARPSSEPASAAAPDAALRTPLLSPRRVPSLFAPALAALARAHLQQALAAIVAPFDACVAVDGASGAVARINAGASLAPASNAKLLTAAAALAILGPEYRFTTRAMLDRDGHVVLLGGGDPMLSSLPARAGAVVTHLDDLARAVATSRRAITGPVLVDDSRFDTARVVPDWKQTYVTEGDVGPLGALSVDGGFDTVLRKPATDPALLTGTRFQERLHAHGVTLAGAPKHTIAGDDAEEIARVDSPPLSAVVEDMLTTSNNYTAELVTRELGVATSKTGTTAAGTSAIVGALASLGVPTAGVTLFDGSGLAPHDRVTCDALLRVLALAHDAKFAAVDRGLPVAGRTGTLALRFLGDPLGGVLRAKTGSINGVVSLSGTVDTGAHVWFAFVANGNFSPAAGGRLQEDIAHAVARYPDSPGTEAVVPAP